MINITNAILNTLFISIPEELFLVTMTLILLKRFDLLDVRMWRQNLKWIMIPVIPTALFSNVFRYIVPLNQAILSTLTIVVLILLTIVIIKKNSYMEEKNVIKKTIIFCITSLAILGMAESLFVPLVVFLLKHPITYFNDNILYNFLFTVPSRTIEFALCSYMLIKKNNSIKINLIDVILKNNFLRNSFISMVIVINIFIIYFIKLIGVNEILYGLGHLEQLIIIILSVSFPVISMGWFLIIINYILVKERQMQQTYKNLLSKDSLE